MKTKTNFVSALFKRQTMLTAAFGAMLAISCSTEHEMAEPNLGDANQIILNTSTSAKSRVKVDGLDVAWAVKDVLYVNSAANQFVGTKAGANAEFAGSLEVVEPQRLHVVFDALKEGANFSPDGASYTVSQNKALTHALIKDGSVNTATLGKNLFLYGATAEVSATTESIDVVMNHGLAVQDFTLSNLDFTNATLTKVELSSSEPFLDNLTYNIESGECTPGESTIKSIPLTIATKPVDAEVLKAMTEIRMRMPILPQTIKSSAIWKFTATMSDGAQYVYTFPNATSDFEYVAGKCYNTKVDFNAMSKVEAIVELDVTTFTADDVAGKTVWYFNNTTLTDINNLNDILASTDNADDITVVFTKLKNPKGVFKGTNIVNVEFPIANLMSVTDAFKGSALKRVSIPQFAKKLPNGAFQDCANLVAVNAPAGEEGVYFDSVLSVGTYAFSGCTSITKASFAKSTDFGIYAFAGCANLESVNTPKVKTVGTYLFSDCAKLKSFTAPAIEAYSTNMFRGCTSLVSVNATAQHPGVNLEGMALVPGYLFRECTSIEQIYAPDASEFGDQAFCGMGTTLKSIELATNSTITEVKAGLNLFAIPGGISTDIAYVALTTGVSNGTTIEGNKWTVTSTKAGDDKPETADSFTFVFASIN